MDRLPKESNPYEIKTDNPILKYNLKQLEESFYCSAGLLENTPLAQNKIINMLGAGGYGQVYLLDNDHVLKIGSIRSSGDYNFYKQYYDNPTKEFIVYFLKQLKVRNIYTFTEGLIYIVEMNKLMTIKQYVTVYHNDPTMEKKSVFPRWLANLQYYLEKEFNNHGLNLQDIVNQMKQNKDYQKYVGTISNYWQFPEDISQKILDCIIQTVSVTKFPDIHFDNLGVNIVNGFDKPQFFFFDR